MITTENLVLAGKPVRTMTKVEVLSIFDRAGGFLGPNQVRAQLLPSPDRRSAYSYLLRLARQGWNGDRPGGAVWLTG